MADLDRRAFAVMIINESVAVMFMIGYPLYGFAMIRTATLPRWCGILVVSTAAWPIAIL